MQNAITSFHGEHRWLSNFAPAAVMFNQLYYPTVENAYQAAKTNDIGHQRQLVTITPGQAKRVGKTFRLSADWDDRKLAVMDDLLWQKFQLPLYRMKLLATGDCMLVEGNTWGDKFWGVCEGEGENHLGKLLMKIRTNLQLEPGK